jgi:hypothetical protein
MLARYYAGLPDDEKEFLERLKTEAKPLIR